MSAGTLREARPALRRLAGLLLHPLSLALLAAVGLLAIGEAISPGFASPGQIVSQLTIAALLGIVAAGQTLVIIGGREGIDLSVGGVISLCAFVAGNLMAGSDAAIPLTLVATLALGFAVGLVNGLGITLLRIPPLVMTLGMTGVIQGVLVILTRGVPSGRSAPALNALMNEPLVAGIPGVLFLWAAVGLGVTLLLHNTTFGVRVYAVGANPEVARVSGMRPDRIRLLLFGLSGLFAGLTGFLILGYAGSVFVGIGVQYILPSIVAVVIGGTSLAGGTGGYLGTIGGAVTLTVLQSLLITLDAGPAGRQVIFGLTLLLLLLLYGRQRGLRG